MLKRYFIILIVFLAIQGCQSSNTKVQSVPQNSRNPMSPVVYQSRLKTGIDVDWVKTNSGRIAIQKSHDDGINVPAIFKERGFGHVRIRLSENILDNSTDITGKTLMQELIDVVDDCVEAGLMPIIAYQAKDFKLNPTDDNTLSDVIEWWATVAERFKNYPYIVAYDLIIETTEEIKNHNDRLNLLYQEATQRIHQIDAERIVIVAPNNISSAYKLKDLVVPQPYDYMMVEWHFYAAGPSRTNPKKLWTTGTEAEKEIISNIITTAKKWSDDNAIPVWVGAWRANRYTKNSTETLYDGAPGGGEYNVTEQVEIADYISKALQSQNIPYAVNSDTKFFNRDTNEWYASMSSVLDAMLQ
ncbi:MAG: glycoside hydrolase family 5 protein [Sulfurovum sp.]|nr:glycoside hydrolase family 5 protein [Sulfurovum sp.]